ncbi:CAAX farnesyltransferase (FTase) subunit beta [Aspergillus tubingensis]|uniref:Protein farnesyltransferase subunit beta n=2 Tax=Aspergillus subgen. Circumdati TaxID=2720871 RepID=A0A100IBB7_ASPNG|nr:CaaX farnesyltransferase beta subunit Ram1 [Aspergillus tubingensis]GAQ38130.1 CaaX farnesyltransferase beta subunit Ram1 [Aspergillus niger]GFN13290.1 CaaX farnesyltransferase beta subunit Ram1 [Aspergillus tubingensis]GLA71051.1 CAAX farnesyltransferase (FTase) subunit beta [Aspergillus tubingensis]GLA82044.1 CAAX farnesyltransferase (FTase) subunit beta [Aspergillus tubingensis]GLA95961.1 CAAX farnesyltransferase (FTase) subunit beta [Aspergillus tubingensis]
MPIVIAAAGKPRRKVRFSSNQTSRPTDAQGRDTKSASSSIGRRQPSAPTSKKHTSLDQRSNSSGGGMYEPQAHPGVPALFQELPSLLDALCTESSEVQNETVNKCLPFLKGIHNSQAGPFNRFGVPALNQNDHLIYLYDSLEDYPEGFAGMDASRPWMVYWVLAGLSLLGEDVTKYRERVVSTFTPMQNPTGGMGGGHGQLSHCASSYATVLALAMVGGEEAFNLIDREAMWRWLGSLKQPDGGFRVCAGGEEDVRGAYCAMVVHSLLNLPLELPPDAEARQHGLETFTSGLSEYLSRCQTYEGGISGSPGSEAHGAYTFCALACLCLMGPPEVVVSRCMDVPLLLSWLSARQYAPEGGFSGRTNKLVDGCYSHWVGTCWPLVQSALNGVQSATGPERVPANLYSREGLTRYILGCCQSKYGGLRDKPGKHPDSYHTCYALTGLSSAQYHHYHTTSSISSDEGFGSAYSWKCTPIPASDDTSSDQNVFDEKDRLKAFHPIFVVPHAAAENLRVWCEQRPIKPKW